MDINPSRTFVTAIEKEHGRALRRYLAIRMRYGAADVPDLVQEVYLRLLRVADYKSIRNPRAYLYTIASHVLHQYLLAKSTAAQSAVFMDISAEFEASPDADPAEMVQIEQRFEELGKRLEQFSPGAYAALLMYRCEGATLEQIGRQLGVSRVMAKKYLVKAVTFCQQYLDELP